MRGNLFAVAVDLVVLTVRDAELCALLVRRDAPPFAGRWGCRAGSSSRTKTCSTPPPAVSARRPGSRSPATTSNSSRATPHRTATRAGGC